MVLYSDIYLIKKLKQAKKIKIMEYDNLLSIHPFKVKSFVRLNHLKWFFYYILYLDFSVDIAIRLMFEPLLYSSRLIFDKNSMKSDLFLYDFNITKEMIIGNADLDLINEMKKMRIYFENYETKHGIDLKEVYVYSVSKKDYSIASKNYFFLYFIFLVEIFKKIGIFFRKAVVCEYSNTRYEYLLFSMFSKQYWIKDGDRYILLADNSNPFIHALKLMLLPLIYPFFLALFTLVTIIGLIKHVNTTGYGTDIDYSKVNC